MNCPNCGKKISIDDAVFCPYCAFALKPPLTQPVSKVFKPMRITAGVLTIIGACLAIVAALIFLIAGAFSLYYFYLYASGLSIFYLIVGVLGILAFAFGLTAGILAIKRRRLPAVLFGMCWLLAIGIMESLPLWLIGVPIAILAVVSVVFAAISRSDFSKS